MKWIKNIALLACFLLWHFFLNSACPVHLQQKKTTPLHFVQQGLPTSQNNDNVPPLEESEGKNEKEDAKEKETEGLRKLKSGHSSHFSVFAAITGIADDFYSSNKFQLLSSSENASHKYHAWPIFLSVNNFRI